LDSSGSINDIKLNLMLTPLARTILEALSAIDSGKDIIQLNNKKETNKEREQRIIQNAIKHKALRAIKKNLQK
jgi:hypothetical protein